MFSLEKFLRVVIRQEMILYYDSRRQGGRTKGISGRYNTSERAWSNVSIRNLNLETEKWSAHRDSRFPEPGSKITVAIAINEPPRRERKNTSFQDVQIMKETRRRAPQEYFLMATTICSLSVKSRGRYW